MLSWVDAQGAAFLRFVQFHQRVFWLAYVSVRTAWLHNTQGRRSRLGVILSQVYYTGVEALPLVSVLGVALGGVVILNASALSFLGDVKLIAQLMVVIVVRELGPLLIALLLIARSGTAVAAEIGNMRINREIDALKVMGINPLSYIVYPRLVGGVVSMICLAFYFNIVSLIGGFAVSRFFHSIPFEMYFNSLTEILTVRDVAFFVSKNILTGLAVFTICCDQGLQVVESPHEVPQATTRAVILSVSAVGGITFLATLIFYFAPLVDWKEVLRFD